MEFYCDSRPFRSFRAARWETWHGPESHSHNCYARTGIKEYLDGAGRGCYFIETTTRDNVNVPPGGYYLAMGRATSRPNTTSMCSRSSRCWLH